MISPPHYQKIKKVHKKLEYFKFRIKSCIDIVPNFKKIQIGLRWPKNLTVS